LNLINNQKTNLKLIQVNDFIKDSTILNTSAITLAKPVGISIKIAGRLNTERITPKRTTKSILVGSIEKGRGNIVDSYKFTNKNKRGAFTVSVRISSARTYSTYSTYNK
jgi:ribosomal protein S3